MEKNYIIKDLELHHLEIPEFRVENAVKAAIKQYKSEQPFAKIAFYKKDMTPLGAGVFFNRYSTGKHYEICLMMNVNLRKLPLRYSMAAILATKKIVSMFKQAKNPVRLQANCLESMRRFQRYAEGIGFKREGLMRKFGINGEDYYRYAIVW